MADITTFTIDDKVWRTFIGKALRNLRRPLDRLKTLAKTIGFKDIIQHFKVEQGPGNKPWEERADSTDEAYARLKKKNARFDPNNKLLQLTGNLRKSLLSRQGEIKTVGNKGILLFTRIPYGGRHNFGGDGTPQREFMYLADEAQDKMTLSLVQWISEL